MAIGVAFGLMGAFFMGGLYVAAALGCLSLIIMFFFSDALLWNIMANKAWEGNTSFILVAVPLFILMGELMNRSGMGERMYVTVSKWIWFLPGGLIHTNIVSCAIFAACSCSSVATSATISRVSLPSFRQRGYNERLVIGSLAAGGTLGIFIPPSISLIIYGVLVEESIGRLYLAGFLPGFMLAGLFMLMIVGVAIIWPSIAPRESGETKFFNAEQWRERVVSLISLIPVAALIFVVLGTIYMGIATPTEAAAFGVSGALVIGVMLNAEKIWQPALATVFKSTRLVAVMPGALRTKIEAQPPPNIKEFRVITRFTWDMMQASFMSTVRTTGMIFFIILAAFTLSFAFARLGISQDIADAITSLDLNQITLVIVLVVFYLVLGTFMESFSMLVTTIPILVPTLEQVGVDLVWFGIIMVILVEAALISPPRGYQPLCSSWCAHGYYQGAGCGGGRGARARHHRRRLDRGPSVHGLYGSCHRVDYRLPQYCLVATQLGEGYSGRLAPRLNRGQTIEGGLARANSLSPVALVCVSRAGNPDGLD